MNIRQEATDYKISSKQGKLYFYKHNLQLGGPFLSMAEANKALKYHIECLASIRSHLPSKTASDPKM